jgi:hypothetical protein
MQQELPVQTEGEGLKHMTNPNDQGEDITNHTQLAKVGACIPRSIPETLRTPRRPQELVVQWDCGQDAGASLPPLQPVEKSTDCSLESCAEGDRLESRQMPACTCL